MRLLPLPGLCLLVCLSALTQSIPAYCDDTSALSLVIDGPVDAELAPVAGRLTTLFYECYPKLLKRFEHPRRKAPRTIRLTFDPVLEIPAHCSGDHVTVSVKWLKAHPEDIGLLTHELTHAVQAYPESEPGWLVEGIADFARHLDGPAKQPGWSLPTKFAAGDSYTTGYGTTARFLVWLEKRHPGVVGTLHRRLQDREFQLEDFQAETGHSVDELWKSCTDELSRAAE